MTSRVWPEAALVALLPCLPLFAVSYAFYGPDWIDHTWLIGYSGAYFREHLTFPDMLNTWQLSGIAYPVYYGFGFYPLLGLLGIVFHPHIVILIVAYGLYCLQYAALTLLLHRQQLPDWFARAASIMVTLAIYPLTNLYNRCDITEFFAGLALSTGIVTLLLALGSEETGQRRRWHAATLALFGFMAVTHPLTLANAAIFMALVSPLMLWIYRRRLKMAAVLIMSVPLMLLPLLSPWLYALYSIGGKLDVSINPWFAIYKNDIDWWPTRLSPILFDRRVWTTPSFGSISTPFLDAPVSLCLLVMAGFMVRSGGRRFAACAIFMLALLGWYVWCSLSYYPWDAILPQVFHIIQLPYRLVNMANLSVLCLLLFAAAWMKERRMTATWPKSAKPVVLVLCTIAACAYGQKMIHVAATSYPHAETVFAQEDYRKSLVTLPGTMYGVNAYVTPALYQGIHEAPALPAFPMDPQSYGELQPLHVRIDAPGWYTTSISASWGNGIMVDGASTDVGIHDYRLAVYLTPGDHQLAYDFAPPALWRVCNWIALATAVALLEYLLASFLPNANRSRPSPDC